MQLWARSCHLQRPPGKKTSSQLPVPGTSGTRGGHSSPGARARKLGREEEDGNHRRQILKILCHSGCCIRSLGACFLLLLQKGRMRPSCPAWDGAQCASIKLLLPVGGRNEPCSGASSGSPSPEAQRGATSA